MSDEPHGLDWIFEEIARRRLMHAAGVYAVLCWFGVQLVATMATPLGMPGWVVQAAIALTFVGLPLVLAARWLMGAPEGAAGRGGGRPVDAARSGGHGTPAARGLGLTEGLVLVAIAFVGGALWVYRGIEVDALRSGALAGDVELPAEVPRTSLAVLPFENAGDDPSEEYFSQGVAEEIRTELSRVPELTVVSRSSSLRYAGTDLGLREIARALRVGSVLEGSVHRAAERVRVTVRLVDARADVQLWAQSFDRPLDTEALFGLESEIARQVARALEVELLGVSDRAPVSLEAHDLYLLGLYHWNRRTGDELERAAELFHAALEAAPGYPLAHVGLANTYVLMPLYAGVPSGEAMPLARRAAQTALAADSTLGEAWAALAFVQTAYDWDWAGAEASFRRATHLNPSYATGFEWYGVLLDALGRFDEAGAAHARALELDPLSLIIRTAAGLHHTFTGAYDDAIRELGRALELQSDFPLGLRFLAVVHLLGGRPADAETALRRWADLSAAPDVSWGTVAAAVSEPGRRDEARRSLAAVGASGVLSPYAMAELYALIGAEAEALDALERAHRERDFLVFQAGVAPAFERLIEAPRYLQLLDAMRLPRPGATERSAW